MKHWETHPEFVEGCWACRITSVAFSATCTPGRRPLTVLSDAREKRFDQDGPAYKRLRQAGLQPPRIDGCAHLEATAEHPMQVERGTTKITAEQCKQAETISRDIGVMV